jgi:hypothetical protein
MNFLHIVFLLRHKIRCLYKDKSWLFNLSTIYLRLKVKKKNFYVILINILDI